ncbi:hypothetical protein ACLKA6_012014 [Drosophila palustris]
MPGGSDRDPSRQLKVPPSRAVRRSSSNSPIPPPKLPAARTVRRSTSNSPIPPSKVPAQSPIGTRSQVQKQSVSTMALSDFTSLADRLSQFEAKLGAASIVEEDVYALEIRRNRITSLCVVPRYSVNRPQVPMPRLLNRDLIVVIWCMSEV